MAVRPLYIEEVETVNRDGIEEPTNQWIGRFVSKSNDLSISLRRVGFKKRAEIIEELGKIWVENLSNGKFSNLVEKISKHTGYSERNVEVDLLFISEVLNYDNLHRLFEKGLLGGWRSLDEPVEVDEGEYVLNVPLTPCFIISTGNTVIPSILPTAVSIASGCVTILKPSIVNYDVVVKVFSPLKELANTQEHALSLAKALLITYFQHNSPGLDYLLTNMPLGVVNYWGGEPGRTIIVEKVSKNPYKPRLLINGPLTGLAIIDEKSTESNAHFKLAVDIILYDQQLCSSPTYAVFIGSWDSGLLFARRLGEALNEVGSIFPKKTSEESLYNFFLVRKKLELSGYWVFSSLNPENPWIVAVYKGRGKSSGRYRFTDSGLSIFQKRRVIEIIVLEEVNELRDLFLELLGYLKGFGVDKVQTVSVALSNDNFSKVIGLLASLGVYRLVPLGESFLRTPAEPYDGDFIPKYFTYTLYIRAKEKVSSVSKYFGWIH